MFCKDSSNWLSHGIQEEQADSCESDTANGSSVALTNIACRPAHLPKLNYWQTNSSSDSLCCNCVCKLGRVVTITQSHKELGFDRRAAAARRQKGQSFIHGTHLVLFDSGPHSRTTSRGSVLVGLHET